MKKFVTFLTAAALTLSAFIYPCSAESAPQEEKQTSSDSVFVPDFEVASKSAYLLNMDSDTVIYSKNADEKFAPSALAQIMTAVIVFEKSVNLDTEVTSNVNLYTEFDAYRAKYEGLTITSADVLPGETLTVRDLLAGMLLQSGCECANILADYVGGGSIEAFVGMMNSRAKELGCINTNFTNPHGLYDDNQYTTASDMALISKRAMEISGFIDICTQYSYKMPASNKHSKSWTIYHSNSMMNSNSDYFYSYAKGIKTANSSQSGRSVVTFAKKSGNRYLAVLMNAPLADADGNNTFGNLNDAKNILNWALTKFEYRIILSEDEEIDGIYVLYADGDGYVNLKPANSYSTLWLSTLSTRSSLTRKTTLYFDKQENGFYYVHAPVNKGDVLGKLTLLLGDNELYTVDLVAATDVKKSFHKENVAMAKYFFGSKQFIIALVLSIAFFIIYTVLIIRLKRCEAQVAEARRAEKQSRIAQQAQPRKRRPVQIEKHDEDVINKQKPE